MKIYLHEMKYEEHREAIIEMYNEAKKEFSGIESAFYYARRKYEFEEAYLKLLEIMKDAIVSFEGTPYERYEKNPEKFLFTKYDITDIMGHSQYSNALKTVNKAINEYRIIREEKPLWANEARKYAKIIDKFIEDRKKDSNLY